MPDMTLEEIYKYYYLVYTPYINEGILAVFSRADKQINTWQKIDNDLWRAGGTFLINDDFHKLTYDELCAEAVMAIHRTRHPF